MYSLASKSTYYSPEKVVTFLVDISQYTVDKTYKKEITFKLIKFTDVSKIQRLGMWIQSIYRNCNTYLLLSSHGLLYILARVWSKFHNIFGCSLSSLQLELGNRQASYTIVHIR